MGLRVIGGELKGRKLYSDRGQKIRPTADRIRESIFNILSDRVRQAQVLDLFSGTGALGIEALSRGAESVVFMDNSHRSLSVIKRNVQWCGIDSRVKIIKWHIQKNLDCLKWSRSGFNLVFIDPPYNRNLIKPTLMHLHGCKPLRSGACVVVEHSSMEPIPADRVGFELSDQRRYGKTLVSFLKYVI